MPRLVETPGSVTFEHAYNTMNCSVYVYKHGPKTFKIYFPIDRVAGMRKFRALVSVETSIPSEFRPDTEIATANSMHNQIVENQLTENNSRLEVIANLLTEIKDVVTPKPARKYTRRKTATKRRVKK